MNQIELTKRYGITIEELKDALHAHLEAINQDGEHAAFKDGHLAIDNTGLSRLDELLHFQPKKTPLELENEELKSRLGKMEEYLANARKAYDEHMKEKQEYERQLEELTRQASDAQEGQKNLSDNLIQKYKSSAEKARMALEYEKERSKDKIETLTRTVEEFKAREKDFEEKMKKHIELRTEYLKLQTEMTISGEEQQRLLKDLREKTEYISDLEDVINSAKETNSSNAMENAMLVKDAGIAIKKIASALSSLQESLGEHVISKNAKEALQSEIEMASDRQRKLMGIPAKQQKQEQENGASTEEAKEAQPASQETGAEEDAEKAAPKTATVIPFHKEPQAEKEPRETAIDTLRQTQQKLREEVQAENELKKKGFFSRVASWFMA